MVNSWLALGFSWEIKSTYSVANLDFISIFSILVKMFGLQMSHRICSLVSDCYVVGNLEVDMMTTLSFINKFP